MGLTLENFYDFRCIMPDFGAICQGYSVAKKIKKDILSGVNNIVVSEYFSLCNKCPDI